MIEINYAIAPDTDSECGPTDCYTEPRNLPIAVFGFMGHTLWNPAERIAHESRMQSQRYPFLDGHRLIQVQWQECCKCYATRWSCTCPAM